MSKEQRKTSLHRTVVLALTFVGILGCGKSNDEKTVAVVLINSPYYRTIHMPSDEVKKMLAAKGINMTGRYCPPNWSGDNGAFIETDGSVERGCVTGYINTDVPEQVDYLKSGERPANAKTYKTQ